MSLLSTIWEFPISYQYGMTIGPEKVWYVNCSNYHKDLPLHLPNFTWWLCAKTMYLSTNWRRCKIVWIYLWWSALCPGHQRRNTWVSSIIWDDYIRYINIRDIKEKSICVRSVAWVGGGKGDEWQITSGDRLADISAAGQHCMKDNKQRTHSW